MPVLGGQAIEFLPSKPRLRRSCSRTAIGRCLEPLISGRLVGARDVPGRSEYRNKRKMCAYLYKNR